jgi:hypothetical protein
MGDAIVTGAGIKLIHTLLTPVPQKGISHMWGAKEEIPLWPQVPPECLGSPHILLTVMSFLCPQPEVQGRFLGYQSGDGGPCRAGCLIQHWSLRDHCRHRTWCKGQGRSAGHQDLPLGKELIVTMSSSGPC